MVCDYSRSTELNYCVPAEEAEFVGKYGRYRKGMDYSYHCYYKAERQLLHDEIMDKFMDTVVIDGELICERPLENWLVFTAGPMGAGKGHTLNWLNKNGLFPLRAFVRVDQDELRSMLPETSEYFRLNPETAGYLTQKEAGYICEVLASIALDDHKNVLIDGSLRHSSWYVQYINQLRSKYSTLKIAILGISASEQTVLARAHRREKITGRKVPDCVLLDTIKQIPRSIEVLSPLVNFIAMFENENDSEPTLLYSSSRVASNDDIRHGMTCGKIEYEDGHSSKWRYWFQDLWLMTCEFNYS